MSGESSGIHRRAERGEERWCAPKKKLSSMIIEKKLLERIRTNPQKSIKL